MEQDHLQFARTTRPTSPRRHWRRFIAVIEAPCVSSRARDREVPAQLLVPLCVCDESWQPQCRIGFGPIQRDEGLRGAKSVFEKWLVGSTGDPPVPSGDWPDGTRVKV